MNKFTALAVAAALSLAFSAAATAQGMSKADYLAAEAKAKTEYSVARVKCLEKSGMEKTACVREARATKARALADAKAQRRSAQASPSAKKEGPKAYVEDSVITAKVKAAVLEEPSLKSAEINVETSKGRVQLSGFVRSRADINRAVEVARRVKGVKSVKNDMILKGTQ